MRSLPAFAVCLLAACSSTPPGTIDGGPTDSGVPPTCDAPNTLCGLTCSTLQLDDANCGACGHGCASTDACAGGACYPRACGMMSCAGSQVCVDQVCLDRACFGVTCPADQACAGGKCAPRDCAGHACAPNEICVSDACVEAACVGVACPAGLLCTRGVCVTDTCRDGVKNGTETDGDCGGVCGPCPDGKACKVTDDCASRSCVGGVCAISSCTDGVRNQDEAAIDCGGSCPKCPASSTCGVGGDCLSGVCTAGRCAQPSCTDGVQNSQESAVDCGGGTCPACANGAACVTGSDCASTLCVTKKCIAPTCQNGAKDNGETDIDCGGPCAPCGGTKVCGVNLDCISGVCDATKKCAAPSCTDLVKNGSETDKDCGGTCSPCAPGLACVVAADCGSKVCNGNVCRAATCNDQVTNGGESDLDCGGATACPRCGEAKACTLPGDCLSNQCVASKCTQPPVFGAPVQLPGGTGPYDVAVDDLDGDGKEDVVVTNNSSFDVTVSYGVGDGTFTSVPAIAVSGNGSGPQGVVIVDLNGDGKKDLVLGRAVGGPGGWGGGRATVIRGAGSRNFLAPFDVDYYHGAWSGGGTGVAVGNFNNDNLLDIAVGDTDIQNYVTNPDNRGGYYWLGLPDGGFGSGGELSLFGTNVAAADFNRDGLIDLVGHSSGRGTANVFLGWNTLPDAGPPPPFSVFGVSAGAGQVRTGMINNDPNPDFVVAANSANRVSVAFGVGDGTFLAPVTYAVTAAYGLSFGDVNRDGVKDLVVGGAGIAVLLGADGGTFGAATYYQAAALPSVGRIATGDFNGDNKPDVAAIAAGKVWILLNVAP